MNIFEMMKQAGPLKAKLEEYQKTLQTKTFTGTAGGDMVTITINGAMEITDVVISQEVLNPEDITMVPDLIKAAHRAAMASAKEQMPGDVQSMFKGL